MSNLLFHDRRLLSMIILMIIVAGISAFLTLPRLEDPELVPRRAMVFTRFPGASATRVESLVTKKIEDRLLDEIEEIKELESTSRAGISVLTVELGDEVSDVDEVWSRIRDQLNEVRLELPEDAGDPLLENLEIRGHSLIAALTWQQETPVNYAILIRLSEEFEELLRSVEGTESVELYGNPHEEIVVEIEPSRLAALGLTVADVSRQIKRTDSKIPAGQMRSNTAGDLLLEIDGQLHSLEQIRQTPIQFSDTGQFVSLGDLGSVSKGIQLPSSDLATVGDRAAIAVGAFVESSFRADLWAKDATAKMAQFQDQLPAGIELEIIFEQTKYTEKRLSELALNLLLGGASVLIVVFLIMGWRSAILVGAALPLSALMVLTGMWILNVPMHQMSITGLILALGLLIDNAIVMVDEVGERLNGGMSAPAAIQSSVRHLAVPLIGSTLTTVLAFMPIALMPGSPGEFVGTIAISVILSLLSSLFLALTVVPALTGIISRMGASVPSHWWDRGVSFDRVTQVYRKILGWLFARPVWGVVLSMVLPVMGFIAASQLTEQFFPPTDRDMFHIEVELPKHASVEQTRELTRKIRQQLLARQAIDDIHWFMGESAPSFYYNIVRDQDEAAFFAQGIVQLKSGEGVIPLIRSVQDELDASFTEARILVKQLEQGPPFNAPIEMRIYGPDLEKLEELGDVVRLAMTETADVTHTETVLSEGLPKLMFRVDEERARRAGIDKALIAEQMNSILEGSVGGSLLEDTEELPVRVRLAHRQRSELPEINSFDVLPVGDSVGSAPKFIPISALGRMELTAERSAITRRNGYRVNTVQGYITAGTLPGKVLDEFQKRLEEKDFVLPDGYWFDIGGENEERSAAVSGLLSSVPILMMFMIVTLVLSLKSFRFAAVIGSVGLLSLGLGMGSLWLLGYPFGFMAIVGSMGLVGVAINDAIVVLSALRENPLARAGDRAAIEDVVVRSTRHVLSTTLTTMAGFLPLILAGGGFWPPLAIAIAGGVNGATILALIFVPSAMILVRRKEPVRSNTKVQELSIRPRSLSSDVAVPGIKSNGRVPATVH